MSCLSVLPRQCTFAPLSSPNVVSLLRAKCLLHSPNFFAEDFFPDGTQLFCSTLQVAVIAPFTHSTANEIPGPERVLMLPTSLYVVHPRFPFIQNEMKWVCIPSSPASCLETEHPVFSSCAVLSDEHTISTSSDCDL